MILATLIISSVNLAAVIAAGVWVVLSTRKAKRTRTRLTGLLTTAAKAAAKKKQMESARASA